jgi:hypothetical protein
VNANLLVVILGLELYWGLALAGWIIFVASEPLQQFDSYLSYFAHGSIFVVFAMVEILMLDWVRGALKGKSFLDIIHGG